jgi:4-hydroxybenzoate polyprenyltransferase
MRGLDLVFAARPLLHVPLWSIYLVTLHYHHHLSGESFGWTDFGMLAAMSLAAAGAYYLNQVHDLESDRLNAKLGFLQRNLLSERALMSSFLITSLASLGLALVVSKVAFAIVLQAFLLGYAYSAPPLRLKDRAIAGLLANAYGIGFLGSLAVMPDLSMNNLGLLGWDAPYYFACAVGGTYLLTTVPDADGDRQTGKRTAVVLLGARITVSLAAACFVGAACFAAVSHFLPLLVIALAAVSLCVTALYLNSIRSILFSAKAPIVMLALLASWYFWGFGLFMIALLLGVRLYYRRRFGLRYPELA